MRQHRCGSTAFETFERESIEQSLIERFELQVDRHRACIAIVDGEIPFAYGSLERWSRVLAMRLIDAGVEPGSRVALILDQGVASMVATLGALRASAVYVPLDTTEPDIRLRTLLHHIEPSAIVTDKAGVSRVGSLASSLPVVRAEDDGSDADVPSAHVAPDAPAYIYFTSGSTGMPKGVLDSHRNVLHNVMRYVNALQIGPRDRLSLVQSPAYSGAVSSMFAGLLTGAAVYPYRLDRGSLGGVADWLRSSHITIYHSVPSILRAVLASAESLPDIRVVRLEGDRSYGQDMAVWRRHLSPGTLIANGLGTTETGLCRQLVVPVDHDFADGIMPVGYAMPDMDVAIVGEDGQTADPGAAGEIAVSSRFLALEHWRDVQLTAAAFRMTDGRPGWRTYRTGDLGRLGPDGCLEYLGRRDGLSKVLGHRVEPAEVEAALATIPGVESVAVRIDEGGLGDGRVVAYVVGPGAADVPVLRSMAAERLPPQMRPQRFVVLDGLPMGPNGKVDRHALPDPSQVPTDHPVETDDPIEARIGAVIAEILGHPIGRDDDFFVSGGDSFAAVDASLALARSLDRDLPASIVVRAPTIAALLAEVNKAGPQQATAYPMSAGGAGAPLVVVPSHFGHAASFALLARHLEPVRPVWAVEGMARPGDPQEDSSVTAVARRHIESLGRSSIGAPFALGGFCYGGVVAFEMARQLLDKGIDVAGVCLLGVSPYDFPELAAPEALERWMSGRRPRRMARRASRYGRGALSDTGRRYVADCLRARGGRVRGYVSPRDRARRRIREEETSAMRPTYGQYRSAPISVPVTVILPGWSLDYTDDPHDVFSRLSGSVDVHVVPGMERMMLSEPVVSTVAAIVAADEGGSEP